MINVPDTLKQHYLDDVISKEIILRFPDDTIEISGGNILSESFELTHSIMDEDEFVLGGCIAGEMRISIINVTDNILNKSVKVFLKIKYATTLYPNIDLFPSENTQLGYNVDEREWALFFGRVISVTKNQNQRNIKEVIAYDALYDFSTYTVGNLISQFSLYTPNVTLSKFHEAVCAPLVGENYESLRGMNKDECLSFTDYNLAKKSEKAKLTALDLIKSNYELNSSFGYIDVRGWLCQKFIYWTNIDEEISSFSDLSNVEEYKTSRITQIKFPFQNDELKTYGTRSEKTSSYQSENNVTKYCTDINTLVHNFYQTDSEHNVYDYIFYDTYVYRPFSATVYNRWWLQAGDKVRIHTGYDDIPFFDSFIFSRTIKGINSMKITIEAKGKQYIGKEDINK